jgi:hypothetical protein
MHNLPLVPASWSRNCGAAFLGMGTCVPGFGSPMTLRAIANDPCQDAEYKGLIGVNVDGSGARLVITVAH